MNERAPLSRKARNLGWLAVLLCGAVSTGCGGGKAKVTGTVTYRGTPLPVGTVTFFAANNQIVGSAPIRDGKYEMKDVPSGPMKISVSTPPAVKPDRRHPPPADMPGGAATPSVQLPPKYNSPTESGLTYEVKGGSQEHSIDLN
jgi:hypothetical protein